MSTVGVSPNVLVSSAGRRHYLVDWFREACHRFDGRVVAADADPHAPAGAAADSFVRLPPITSGEYEAALQEACNEHEIGLAISVNDHELARWSTLVPVSPDQPPASLLCLDERGQALVEDKLLMAEGMAAQGIPVPTTRSGAMAGGFHSDVVIKARFGSGSNIVATSHASTAAADAVRLVPRATDRLNRAIRDEQAALDALVVQDRKTGQEYGVDVVNDFDGNFVGVLARRKIRMRGGETDQAESVAPDQFIELGKSLSRVLGHRGLVDCDVIQSEDGSLWLIDVNPRFGGGYPFSHLAGADVPLLYLHWLVGAVPASDLLAYRPGVTSAKHVGLAVVNGSRQAPVRGRTTE